MSKLNLEGLVGNLQKVLDAAQALAPIAAEIGGPTVANVATIGLAAAATIENVLDRAADLKGALSSQDEAKLRAMLAELQPVNDQLAESIAKS